MDKYEFNIKVEQIKKLLNKKDYATAMKIADTIDWRRVRNVRLLSLISQIYEYNYEYRDAKEILLMAYERAPVGKRILYKLVELAIREGKIPEAELFFKEFLEISSTDPRQYLLQYELLSVKEASLEERIQQLETYKGYDFDEKWSYELAKLYDLAGMDRACVSLCDSIALWFGFGKYVEKALNLKQKHEPLTQDQQELLDNKGRLEEKLSEIQEEYNRINAEKEIEKGKKKEVKKEEVKKEEVKKELKGDVSESEPQKGSGRLRKDELLEAASADPASIEVEEILEINQNRLAAEIGKLTDVYQKEEEPKESLETYPSSFQVNQDTDKAEQEVNFEEEEFMEEPEDSTAAQTAAALAESGCISKLPEEKPEYNHSSLYEVKIEELEPEVKLQKENDRPRLRIVEESEEESEEQSVPDIEDAKEDIEEKSFYHIMVRSSSKEEGLQLAVAALKKMHAETGTPVNKVAKISAEKMNQRGILNSLDIFTGKSLVIEDAGSLTGQMKLELGEVLRKNLSPISVVLIDKPEIIRKIQKDSPEFSKEFSSVVGDSEELDVKAFVNYARGYSGKVDCVIDDMGVLALYAIAEERISDGLNMTEEEAEIIVENAAEVASRRSLKKVLTGVFSSRYNKDGMLILKEEHFK